MSAGEGGTLKAPATGQRYWFHGGFFYAQVGHDPNTQAPAYGRWMMHELSGDTVPDGAVAVWFGGPPGDGGPSDVDGLSWHEACIKARLEGAQQRTDLTNARRDVLRHDRNAAAASSALESERAARRGAMLALEPVVRRLEMAYGGDGSRTEAAIWREGGSAPYDPEWSREDFWTEWPIDQALEQLATLVGELADSDHPSITWPEVGKRTRATAAATFRHHVGAGATLEQALEAVLVEAAGTARPAPDRQK